MQKDNGFDKLSDILNQKKEKKAPAYKWQDMALRVINELDIPNFKRSSVFKVCKENPQQFIERCMNDTKELCESGEKWKYFFKVVSEAKADKQTKDKNS